MSTPQRKSLSEDLIGSLLFLAFSAGYAYSATLIPAYPGDEYEPFTAQTLPLALSTMGVVLSLLLLVGTLKTRNAQNSEQALQQRATCMTDVKPDYDWKTVLQLIALMLFYAVGLKWLGFIIATTVFLAVGYWVLGERRKKILFGASLPFVLLFWFALTQLLDIYLAPGQLFHLLG
ncbi:putative tricarboxylic transport membrane protein [Oceanospirillum multiglobuliferum]|uniref:DUF1468 domain-containing protein n=1 Tax=Oceanospirillum multiglobuliferum TaxID=64969 RepID=A0A1T4QVC6_9GAMM|nr:tripartite tricarboxylate transporter TctB family protein [Oceanospirillum multiglobuliferum]OPX57113.1 hypothetical protein BTE48_01425 [Oceanospirillum multiglobuliferum]SKA07441.1 putative tricarboxylic transport membrane protein [Oceanospirillum multiglobuliferum]